MHKTAKFRRLASVPTGAPPAPNTTDASFVTAEVLAVLSPQRVQCMLANQRVDVALATHLPMPMPGQRVLVALAHSDAPLIVAAYPSAAQPAGASAPQAPIQLDPATGVLRIEASHLQLAGLASVELRCGSAVLQLNVQGEALLQAEAITQSAIGAHRIEGASIDLN